MKRRIAVGLALALALLGSTFAGTAMAQTADPQTDAIESWRTDDPQSDGVGNRDRQNDNWDRQNDNWDRQYDNRDQRKGWWQRAHVNFQGRWVSADRSIDFRSNQGEFRGRGGMRGGFLPGYLRISQGYDMLRIADYDNRLLQRIIIASRHRSRDDGRGHLIGWWHGSELEVQRDGPRGSTIIQTFSLENRGRTLMVRTRHEGGRSRRVAEFTSVYRRA